MNKVYGVSEIEKLWRALMYEMTYQEHLTGARERMRKRIGEVPWAMITMELDCRGYDPDAVLQKLEAKKAELYAFHGPRTLYRLCSLPISFKRTKGGIEAFLKREVLPYAADAWYRSDSVKIGYEISFTRYFYKPQPMRSLEEIRADILALEQETEGLLGEIIGGMEV